MLDIDLELSFIAHTFFSNSMLRRFESGELTDLATGIASSYITVNFASRCVRSFFFYVIITFFVS